MIQGVSGKGSHARLHLPWTDTRAFYRREPGLFIRGQLNVPIDAEQEAVALSVRDNLRTSVRSGHGVGKTTILACIIAWFTYCFEPSLVLATAPTQSQLYDVLWSELARVIYGSKLAADYVWTATGLTVRGRQHWQVAQARTSNNPQALAGRHQENILLVIEEASAVNEDIILPAEGSLTAKNARLLAVGNPVLRSGFFFRAFNQERGDYARFHISGEGHPRVSSAYVERIARRYGRDSDVYRVRVKGEFPVGDPKTFITSDRVARAQAREVAPDGPWRIGVDVSGMGDDRTVLLPGRGHYVEGKLIETHSRLASSSEVVAPVLRLCRRLKRLNPELGPVLVAVDGGGLGWGPAGDLAKAADEEPDLLHVIIRNFGGSGDAEYANEASWMWGRMRDEVDHLQLPPSTGDDSLADQLADELSRRYFSLAPDGRIKIEPKDEYKERSDNVSPDLADAAVLWVSTLDWDPGFTAIVKSKLDPRPR